jgi:hypothetical protein
MDRHELLWRQYASNIELFKHYLKLAIEINVFYYGISGALVSFALSRPEIESLRFALLLPLVMSLAFAGLYVYGASLLTVMREETFKLRDQLELEAAPDLIILSVLLWVSAALFVLSAIGFAVLVCAWPPA